MADGRRSLIAGNWKMNGLREDGLALAAAVAGRMPASGADFDMLVCPPFTLLGVVGDALNAAGGGVALGAQDCHADAKGAHTGDVAAPMLADIGCTYVIVGHSERRADHGESDADVRAKAEAVLAAGMTAIVCVGETEDIRDAGKAEDVVTRQIAGSLPPGATAANVVVAYEPVWAIGTGRTPTADDVQTMHAAMRAHVGTILGASTARAMRLLYGGSVKPGNAGELMTLPDVDGGLIGGASLKAEDFWGIAERGV